MSKSMGTEHAASAAAATVDQCKQLRHEWQNKQQHWQSAATDFLHALHAASTYGCVRRHISHLNGRITARRLVQLVLMNLILPAHTHQNVACCCAGFDNIEPWIGWDNNVMNIYFNKYLPLAVRASQQLLT
jgi:hypothetical protein